MRVKNRLTTQRSVSARPELEPKPLEALTFRAFRHFIANERFLA